MTLHSPCSHFASKTELYTEAIRNAANDAAQQDGPIQESYTQVLAAFITRPESGLKSTTETDTRPEEVSQPEAEGHGRYILIVAPRETRRSIAQMA